MSEKEFTVDLRTGQLSGSAHSGCMGQISWRRLVEEVFRSSGEIHPHEKVIIVTANERGLRFIVVDNDPRS
jgi:hypothetical protein